MVSNKKIHFFHTLCYFLRMGHKAREIENETLLNQGENKRLFKINAGMGWCGQIVSQSREHITLKNPRPLHAAPSGWPDLAGWETITVTPDMVGKKIAVFVGEEIKAGSDRLRPAQVKFKNLLEKMGGVFRVITD